MGPNELKVKRILDQQIDEHGTVQLVSNPDGWGALPLLRLARRVDEGAARIDELDAEIAARLGKADA